HKSEILAVCDQAIRERKRRHQGAVPWSFVIVREAGAGMANHNGRFVELDKMLGRGLAAFRCRYVEMKDRIERVLGEDMFNVGEHKLLVLLLVMQAEGEDRFQLLEQGVVSVIDQLHDALIDRFSKAVCFGHGWARDQSAKIASVHVTSGVVV